MAAATARKPLSAAPAKSDYQDLEPIGDIKTALARKSFVMPTRTLTRGRATAKIKAAEHRLQGKLSIGGQEHFYLEGQVGFAIPGEDRTMFVYSSTQHTSE